MKKFIKSMMVACLAIIAICPVIFTACAKTYTITISVQTEGGKVYATNEESKQIHGENNVKEDENFEYFVKPLTGYQISKVEIDGEEYTEEYNKNGCYLSILEVNANHNIKVWFEKIDIAVSLICSDGELTTITVKYGDTLNLNNYGGAVNNGWYIMNDGQKIDLFDEYNNEITIWSTSAVQIKTDIKTKSQIQALMGNA